MTERNPLPPCLAHLAQLEPRWQPIETAPKDGTEFDGWNGIERVPDVSWDDACPDDAEGRYFLKWWRRVDQEDCVTWYRIEMDRRLTHWMPLPEPQP